MSDLTHHWQLEPGLDFLNHGSFGACPRAVLAEQQCLREELERQPVAFLARRLPALLDDARARLAAFLRADPEGLVAVTNATTGVNTVLASLELSPGDELLTTDHAYNACRNALDAVARRAGARVVAVPLPFPAITVDEVCGRLLAAVRKTTRFALVDHVTSPTGLVLPVERLAAAFADRGVPLLVDGAHAPGMVKLNLDALGCAAYTGNCHKWLCAPKGAAFLWLREDLRGWVRPLVISHGANTRRPGRSRFHDEFDWTGTGDPTPFLSVPAAIDCVGAMVEGGWPEVRRRNRSLALAARRLLVDALQIDEPCPAEMIGSLAAVPLPGGLLELPRGAPDPLQQRLLAEHRIEVPVMAWPALGRRLLRVSAQLYNDHAQYERLAAALGALLPQTLPGC